MTLRELIAAQQAGEDDVLLTPRQVATLIGEPYDRIRRWVYVDKSMPSVPYGPHRRKMVLASVVIEMFCPHRRPVRVLPSHLRPCGSRVSSL